MYMMLCEGARPAGIEEGSSKMGTFAKLKHLSRTKNNGICDFRWATGRIQVQNVINKQFSSYSVRCWC